MMKKTIDLTDAEVAIAVSALSEYESKIGSSNMSKDIVIPMEFIKNTAIGLKEKLENLIGFTKEESYYAKRKRLQRPIESTVSSTSGQGSKKRGRKKKEASSIIDKIKTSTNGRKKRNSESTSIPVDKVKQYLNDGITPTEMSKVENVTLRTIHRWISKVRNENPGTTSTAKRGRKPKINGLIANSNVEQTKRGRRPRIKKEASTNNQTSQSPGSSDKGSKSKA
jgi:hypothetical protein